MSKYVTAVEPELGKGDSSPTESPAVIVKQLLARYELKNQQQGSITTHIPKNVISKQCATGSYCTIQQGMSVLCQLARTGGRPTGNKVKSSNFWNFLLHFLNMQFWQLPDGQTDRQTDWSNDTTMEWLVETICIIIFYSLGKWRCHSTVQHMHFGYKLTFIPLTLRSVFWTNNRIMMSTSPANTQLS